ncbi:hypothetical protein [Nocardiopsis rhodophaea]|uniref:hypothetical protein n=1 Tax=Nocardiopsis rhodophaea TaxID=280238 RepID=UPI0031DC7914
MRFGGHGSLVASFIVCFGGGTAHDMVEIGPTTKTECYSVVDHVRASGENGRGRIHHRKPELTGLTGYFVILTTAPPPLPLRRRTLPQRPHPRSGHAPAAAPAHRRAAGDVGRSAIDPPI